MDGSFSPAGNGPTSTAIVDWACDAVPVRDYEADVVRPRGSKAVEGERLGRLLRGAVAELPQVGGGAEGHRVEPHLPVRVVRRRVGSEGGVEPAGRRRRGSRRRR